MGNTVCPCCAGSSVNGSQATRQHDWGGGQLGGEEGAREMRLRAAEQRQGDAALKVQTSESAAAAAEARMKNNGNLTAEKNEELASKRKKEDLIGKITHYYQKAGREPPFGLSAATMDGLKKQLDYAKGLNSIQNT